MNNSDKNIPVLTDIFVFDDEEEFVCNEEDNAIPEITTEEFNAPDINKNESKLEPVATNKVKDTSNENTNTISGTDIHKKFESFKHDIETLIDDISEDARDELSMQMEQVIKGAVDTALSEALERSSVILKKSLRTQLSTNLPPILEMIMEEFQKDISK